MDGQDDLRYEEQLLREAEQAYFIRCKRCGVLETDAKQFRNPCHNFEKRYTKHLFIK